MLKKGGGFAAKGRPPNREPVKSRLYNVVYPRLGWLGVDRALTASSTLNPYGNQPGLRVVVLRLFLPSPKVFAWTHNDLI